MIVADTEPHEDGWRWLIVDLATGERLCTGEQTYWHRDSAWAVGELVRVSARTWPTIDTTETP